MCIIIINNNNKIMTTSDFINSSIIMYDRYTILRYDTVQYQGTVQCSSTVSSKSKTGSFLFSHHNNNSNHKPSSFTITEQRKQWGLKLMQVQLQSHSEMKSRLQFKD